MSNCRWEKLFVFNWNSCCNWTRIVTVPKKREKQKTTTKQTTFSPEASFKHITMKAASKPQLCVPQHRCHPGQSFVHPGEENPLPSTNLLQSHPGSGLLAHFCLCCSAAITSKLNSGTVERRPCSVSPTESVLFCINKYSGDRELESRLSLYHYVHPRSPLPHQL